MKVDLELPSVTRHHHTTCHSHQQIRKLIKILIISCLLNALLLLIILLASINTFLPFLSKIPIFFIFPSAKNTFKPTGIISSCQILLRGFHSTLEQKWPTGKKIQNARIFQLKFFYSPLWENSGYATVQTWLIFKSKIICALYPHPPEFLTQFQSSFQHSLFCLIAEGRVEANRWAFDINKNKNHPHFV